jgi:uncharacterized protein (DUF305 family)
MKNNNYIFAIVGLLVGVVGTNLYLSSSPVHQMPDGTEMTNSGDMGDMMDGMMQGLAGKTGEEFDRAFLSEMIVHHQGAVDMAQAVLKNSNRPELLNLAREIITAQTKEIEMMKNWQASWFTK